MMITMNQQLEIYLKIAQIHIERIRFALNKIAHLRPFIDISIATLSGEEVSFVELATSRFGKLQDLIGAKIFPLLLKIVREDQQRFTFIDRLNKLEQLNFITDAHAWLAMKDMRNHITHEYPDEPEMLAKCLNDVLEQTDKLMGFWSPFKTKIEKVIAESLL